MATKEAKIEMAKKKALQKLGFIRHALIYVLVMVALAIVNNATSGGYQWWLWPALGWGIGVAAHFLSVYVFQGSTLEKRLIQRELERLDDEE
jgi:hypothetical protein